MRYTYIILLLLPLVSFAENSTNKTNNAEKYIKKLCFKLNLFKLDSRSYPSNEEGLIKLIEPRLNDGGIAGKPYLVQIDSDPWGNQYQYLLNKKITKVWSMGPDGLSGNANDIGNKPCN